MGLQAGWNITSESQWAALSKKSVPLDKVQEGDLVFTAGSDGSAGSPGHVGMMINSKQLIQAPSSGQDVQIIPYYPNGWSHAARPSGSGAFLKGTVGGSTGASNTANSGASTGNAGLRGGSANRGASGGVYGATSEASLIANISEGVALSSHAAGGTTIPGLALVGERGPELMMTSGGQRVFSNAQTMQLIHAIRGNSPAQSP